jgi:hypothetical protein
MEQSIDRTIHRPRHPSTAQFVDHRIRRPHNSSTAPPLRIAPLLGEAHHGEGEALCAGGRVTAPEPTAVALRGLDSPEAPSRVSPCVAAGLRARVGRARAAPLFRRRRGRGDGSSPGTTTHAGIGPIGDVARVTGVGSIVPPATAPERRRLAGSAHAGTETRGYAW